MLSGNTVELSFHGEMGIRQKLKSNLSSILLDQISNIINILALSMN